MFFSTDFINPVQFCSLRHLIFHQGKKHYRKTALKHIETKQLQPFHAALTQGPALSYSPPSPQTWTPRAARLSPWQRWSAQDELQHSKLIRILCNYAHIIYIYISTIYIIVAMFALYFFSCSCVSLNLPFLEPRLPQPHFFPSCITCASLATQI